MNNINTKINIVPECKNRDDISEEQFNEKIDKSGEAKRDGRR